MKVLMLNGGGLDSLCMAKLAREQNPDAFVQSLYVSYGLPSAPHTAKSAQRIADRYCNAHEAFYMQKQTGDQKVSASLFTTSPTAAGNLFRHVPHYGLLLIVTAYSYAIANGFTHILCGIKKEARSPEFFKYFEKTLKTAKLTGSQPILETPLFDAEFALIHHLIKDDPLITKTWSCNEDHECGVCVKCQLRKKFAIIYDGGSDA